MVERVIIQRVKHMVELVWILVIYVVIYVLQILVVNVWEAICAHASRHEAFVVVRSIISI